MFESFQNQQDVFMDEILKGTLSCTLPKEKKFHKLTRICVSIKIQPEEEYEPFYGVKMELETITTEFIDYLKQKCPKITNFHSENDHSGNFTNQLITLQFHGKAD